MKDEFDSIERSFGAFPKSRPFFDYLHQKGYLLHHYSDEALIARYGLSFMALCDRAFRRLKAKSP